jgi:DNA/RNA-binding domain of Phe-tRNA-synthetase-like protein
VSLFGYAPEIIERFPGIRGGVLHATGLENGPATARLTAAYHEEQHAALQAVGDTPLSEIPSVAAWRRAFAAFGVKPTQYRSAAEALLRRLTKQGSIPSINLLVDLGNLVAVRRRLPVAVFDQAPVTGGTTVRPAGGGEWFTDLGGEEPTHPEPGEVIFADDTGLVSARRWCWRQSAQSAAGPHIAEALITVEGHHDAAQEDVEAALEDLRALLGEYQPGATLCGDLLSPERPVLHCTHP